MKQDFSYDSILNAIQLKKLDVLELVPESKLLEFAISFESSEDILHNIFLLNNKNINYCLLHNPNTSGKIIEEIYNSKNYSDNNDFLYYLIKHKNTPKYILDEVTSDEDTYKLISEHKLQSLAIDFETSVEVLHNLSLLNNTTVNNFLLNNTRLSSESIEIIYNDRGYFNSLDNLVSLIKHKNTPRYILEELFTDKNINERILELTIQDSCIYDIFTSTLRSSIIDIISTSGISGIDDRLLIMVLHKGDLPLDILDKISESTNVHVLQMVAALSDNSCTLEKIYLRNLKKKREVLYELAKNRFTPQGIKRDIYNSSKNDQDRHLINEYLGSNPSTPKDILDEIYKKAYAKTLMSISSHPHTAKYMLRLLSHHENKDILINVLENNNSPKDVVKRLKHQLKDRYCMPAIRL